MNALIIMKKGEGNDFLTPVENLDNIKRVLAGKYKRIEFPDYVEELDGEDEVERHKRVYSENLQKEDKPPVAKKKRNRGPNKPKPITQQPINLT